MREQPWHLRRASAEHHQWYRNLIDLHALTLSWLGEMKVERPAHFLSRGVGEEIAETLWMLDILADAAPRATRPPGAPDSPGAPGTDEQGLDSLLDDTAPEDLLGRLDHLVHASQASVLHQIVTKTPSGELAALRNQLEQASWKAGRACAGARWPDLDAEARGDLRGVLAAYRDSPLSGFPSRDVFLIRRAVSGDLQLELRECPHQSRYLEVKQVADELCPLLAHWTRGFAYELNTRITIEYERGAPDGRCLQRWLLPR